MIIPRLAVRSLLNRRVTAILTVVSISLSVMLFLGVEKVRNGARESFATTLSGTDLVIGAKSGSIQLLLYTIFTIGNATNEMTWRTYQEIAERPEVDWIVPISLGDSHEGFRVFATSADYFTRYRYGRDRQIAFAAGGPFGDLFEAVVGSAVAKELGYSVDDRVVVAHGAGLIEHDNFRYRVTGILAPSGTPIDRMVLISLEAFEANHLDWQFGTGPTGDNAMTEAQASQINLTPRSVTGAMIAVKPGADIAAFKDFIDGYRAEPLTAIEPRETLDELWSALGIIERALLAVSGMVVATALIAMVTALLSNLNERRREMAILRSVGARPATLMGLLVAEAGGLAAAGVVLGTVCLYAFLFAGRSFIEDLTGLAIPISLPSSGEMLAFAAIVVAGFLVGFLPALRAYRLSLADGLVVRL